MRELDADEIWNSYPDERADILRFGAKAEEINVRFYFLSDDEWDNEIENWLENEGKDSESKYKRHVKKWARSFEWAGDVYVKESARKDEDFLRLILHELGHAVCNLWHVDRKGDIMNGDFRQWYGVKK